MHDGDAVLQAIVKLAENFNGADLRNICTEAGMFAIRDERDYVVHEDFMKAARKGVPKHDFAYPAAEVQKIAYCGDPHKFEYYLPGTAPGGCAAGSYFSRRHADAFVPGGLAQNGR